MPRPDIQWLVLNDFSPGIQDNVNHTGAQAVPGGALGAATRDNTYRCIALPTGGLGPLPRRSFNILTGDYPINPNPAVTDIRISGAHLTGPILTAGADGITPAALYIATEYLETVGLDTLRRWDVYQVGLWLDPPSFLQIDHFAGIVDSAAAYRGTWFADYRAQTSEENESVAGYPCIVYAWYPDGGGEGSDIWHVWPDITVDPAANDFYDINAAEFTGFPLLYLSNDKVVGHQGRYVGFEQTFFLHGPGATWSSDEQIYFSDTNLLTLYSRQASAFGYEKMTGFGVALSSSTDELLCIKHRGGALTINGPLESPTIVWLPGVTSTGGYSSQSVYTPVGAVYGVKDGGVYAWAGGDNAVKLSHVLEDDFWLAPDLEVVNQYRGQFAYWDDWIIAPNNWLFDLNSQGWWRLEDPDLYTFWLAQRDIVNNNLFTLPVHVTDDADVLVGGFEKSEVAHDYSWTSQPIQQTMDQQWRCREIVLVAQGEGTVRITLSNQLEVATSSQTFEFTLDSGLSTPQSQRITVAQYLAASMQVRIQAAGPAEDPTSPAPIIYEVRLGWFPRQHLASAGVAEPLA